MSSRIPELYIATLGTLKNGSVAAPLFSAFGPEPIETRFNMGEGRVLVTTEPLYRRRVAPVRDQLPDLEHVLLVRPPGGEPVPGTQDLHDLMARAGDAYEIGPTDPEDMALLHFTSGTTGRPKGAVHVHGGFLVKIAEEVAEHGGDVAAVADGVVVALPVRVRLLEDAHVVRDDALRPQEHRAPFDGPRELIGTLTTVRGRRATGISLVIHPRNPYVPTAHANVRFFIAGD